MLIATILWAPQATAFQYGRTILGGNGRAQACGSCIGCSCQARPERLLVGGAEFATRAYIESCYEAGDLAFSTAAQGPEAWGLGGWLLVAERRQWPSRPARCAPSSSAGGGSRGGLLLALGLLELVQAGPGGAVHGAGRLGFLAGCWRRVAVLPLLPPVPSFFRPGRQPQPELSTVAAGLNLRCATGNAASTELGAPVLRSERDPKRTGAMPVKIKRLSCYRAGVISAPAGAPRCACFLVDAVPVGPARALAC